MILFMSKQVSLTKISYFLQEMKIDPKSAVYALFARKPCYICLFRDFIKDGTPDKMNDCENDYACLV